MSNNITRRGGAESAETVLRYNQQTNLLCVIRISYLFIANIIYIHVYIYIYISLFGIS